MSERGSDLEGVRLALVILAVENLGRSLAFYRRAFPWPQTVEVSSYAEFSLPGGLRLGLYERRGFGLNTGQVPHPIPVGGLAPAELYLYPADLEATMEAVSAAGGRLLSELKLRGWGEEAVYYSDPDGHVVALARPPRRDPAA
jgi:predicted enzyme related to lactoylglutathione lyase